MIKILMEKGDSGVNHSSYWGSLEMFEWEDWEDGEDIRSLPPSEIQ